MAEIPNVLTIDYDLTVLATPGVPVLILVADESNTYNLTNFTTANVWYKPPIGAKIPWGSAPAQVSPLSVYAASFTITPPSSYFSGFGYTIFRVLRFFFPNLMFGSSGQLTGNLTDGTTLLDFKPANIYLATPLPGVSSSS